MTAIVCTFLVCAHALTGYMLYLRSRSVKGVTTEEFKRFVEKIDIIEAKVHKAQQALTVRRELG